ncbi:MAG: phosphatase PAP2 family protein [Armatimonadota bacterium]
MNLDVQILKWCNTVAVSPWADNFMLFVTNQHKTWPLILLALIWLIWKGGKTGRHVAMMLPLCILLTDQISAHLLKDLIGRTRPCCQQDLFPWIRLIDGCRESHGMPSSHATNMFGVATLFTLYYRKWWPVFFTIAAIISYTRMYLGLHFPSDVLVGAILGSLIVLGFDTIWRAVANKRESRKSTDSEG